MGLKIIHIRFLAFKMNFYSSLMTTQTRFTFKNLCVNHFEYAKERVG